MRSLILLTVLATTLVLGSQTEKEAPKPDQILELFRHGARGPMHRYDDSWPDSEWELYTAPGMRQQYVLGKVLALKYPHLIGTTYDYNKIYMFADDSPRCIQSAYAQLYGMYIGDGPSLRPDYPREMAVPPFQDPRVKEIANSLPNSQAIPNNFESAIVDIAFGDGVYIFQGNYALCPNFGRWVEENEKDARMQEGLKIFAETMENANKHLPQDRHLKTPSDVTGFGDSLYVNYYDNRTLPGGINDPALISNLTWAFAWFSYYRWDAQLLQRQVGAYNYVAEMLKQMEAFRKGENYKIAALYSAHDDNIFALLAAFGLMTEKCIMENFESHVRGEKIPHPHCVYPFFSSQIITEFYNTTSPYVRMYYGNVELAICNGKYSCPYEEFVAYCNNAVGNLTWETYKKACNINIVEPKLNMSNFDDTEIALQGQGSSMEMTSYMMGINIDLELMALGALILVALFLSAKIAMNKKKYEKLVEENRSDYTSAYNQIPEVETR